MNDVYGKLKSMRYLWAEDIYVPHVPEILVPNRQTVVRGGCEILAALAEIRG